MRQAAIRHLHFIGIGGVGMCGLAELLLAQGFEISGCDAAPSERTRRLAGLGARCYDGHDPSHLAGVDAVVVTAAIDLHSPELQAARERGLRVARRAELLADMTRGKRTIAIAGTHGKTTTTALIGHVLSTCGLDPSVVVGGRVRGLEAHARYGRGEVLVCEADEFDRAFWELRPTLAVVTNIEAEHLDTYGSLAEVESAFVHFANAASLFGCVVFDGDDPGAQRMAARMDARGVSYGLAPEASLRAVQLDRAQGGSRFLVERGGAPLGPVEIPLAGVHNVRNTLAALAIGLELGLGFGGLAEACASFPGVARRFELRGERAGVTVVDDYAHHPTEIAAVIAAARQSYAGRRLVVAFQPHLYSRTQHFAADFGRALAAADQVLVLPIYAARETPIVGVDSQLIVDATRAAGQAQATAAPGLGGIGGFLEQILRPGDVLLSLGAGDVFRVAETWLEARS